MKKIFISYAGEDRRFVNDILYWNEQNSFGVEFIADDPLQQLKLESEIISFLKKMIDRSDAVIVFIGDNTHSKSWVEWEYNYAQNKKKKFAIMRVPNSTGSSLRIIPDIEEYRLRIKNLKKILKDWNW